MTQVHREAVLSALASIKDPDKGQDIVSLGMVGGLSIDQGHVSFAIKVERERGQKLEPMRKAAEDAVRAVTGVSAVSAVLYADREAPEMPHQHAAPQQDALLPEVRAVIAVASGKGGVGKSTTAVNLALALKGMGLSVGLFDADIFGPSQPRLLGVVNAKPYSPDGEVVLPIEAMGLKVMSIGFMVPEDSPVVWRGPMVMGAVEQLLRDVQWGKLDVLVVDMPPGTGDVQLTMTQKVPLSGAVIVSTPQDIALIDARKGLNMFVSVNVPVLGIIENMSYYHCPSCGHEDHIFGHGGAKSEAEKLGTEFLGELPLDTAIRSTSDQGKPIVESMPDSPLSAAYKAIAAKIWAKVEGKPQASGPRIVMK